MDALILAAGFGTRLGELTKKQQKCLLPVRGRPLLDYWISYFVELGIDKIYINSHHCAEDLDSFVKNHEYSKKINILYEKELLGTAGTLVKNINKFENDLFFIHGDNFIEFKAVKDFYNSYNLRNSPEAFWMMIHKTHQPKNCGVVKLNNNIVVEFHEKVEFPPSDDANSAIYILSKNFIDKLKVTEYKFPLSFSDDIIPQHLGNIHGYLSKESVIDIGLIDNYMKVR